MPTAGQVVAITIDADRAAPAARSATTSLYRNAEYVFRLTFGRSASDSEAFAFDASDAFWAGLGASFELADEEDPIVAVDSGFCSLSDWADADQEDGKVSFRLSLKGEEVGDALGTRPIMGAYVDLWALSDDGRKSLVAHVPVAVKNIVIDAFESSSSSVSSETT